jgi:outer membrane lipoprotein-sorting protein
MIKQRLIHLKIVMLVCTINSIGFAQEPAKNLLDDVSAKIKSYDNIFIDFKYVINNSEEDIRQETRGDVTMQGDKYVLNILGVTRIFDGKTLYSISPEDEEVTISSDNTEEENTIAPSKMLTFYENGYSYAMDIVQNVKGRKIQYVKLAPIDSNSEINHVLLGIDIKTRHIYNLIEVGKNKTQTTLTVNSFKTNEPLSKTLFSFDESKYEDYFINKID